jgi:hypothetical protein
MPMLYSKPELFVVDYALHSICGQKADIAIVESEFYITIPAYEADE